MQLNRINFLIPNLSDLKILNDSDIDTEFDIDYNPYLYCSISCYMSAWFWSPLFSFWLKYTFELSTKSDWFCFSPPATEIFRTQPTVILKGIPDVIYSYKLYKHPFVQWSPFLSSTISLLYIHILYPAIKLHYLPECFQTRSESRRSQIL
jgi:hypothetical protein